MENQRQKLLYDANKERHRTTDPSTSYDDHKNNGNCNHIDNDTDTNDDDGDDDWGGEAEWDGSSPFWIHCVAGSIAGVVEHGATYPLDTVRTHIQVCAACVQRVAAATTGSLNTVDSSTLSSSSSSQQLLKSGKNAAATTTSNATTGVIRNNPLSSPGTTAVGQLPLDMWQTIRYLMHGPSALLESGATGGVGGVLSSAQPSAATLLATNSTHCNNSNVNSATITTQQRLGSTSSSVFQRELQLEAARSGGGTGGGGFIRLWRGVQTIMIGCIPAHALYFSTYELIKHLCMDHDTGTLPAWGSSLAGAFATLGHDIIMTPLDTIKQRMQIGYYPSGTVMEAVRAISASESYVALYRSFPVTVASNIPYGMIMVTTNETCKHMIPLFLHNHSNYHYTSKKDNWYTVLASSSIAGFVASACTTPLDRIKTALQTQQLAPNCILGKAFMASCPNAANASHVLQQHQHLGKQKPSRGQVPHNTWYQATSVIYRTEGIRGFFRGITPRVLSHTPAVAISWTTYETTKQYLLQKTSS